MTSTVTPTSGRPQLRVRVTKRALPVTVIGVWASINEPPGAPAHLVQTPVARLPLVLPGVSGSTLTYERLSVVNDSGRKVSVPSGMANYSPTRATLRVATRVRVRTLHKPDLAFYGVARGTSVVSISGDLPAVAVGWAPGIGDLQDRDRPLRSVLLL